MRAFIAIELPDEIKNFLGRLQEKLKASGADVSWVKPANIHLTLKFLGEIREKKLEKIIQLLEGATGRHEGFTLDISSLGAFPSIGSARVIWVGIEKGDKEAKTIAGELEEEICRIGIPKEKRPFQSHITIGRARSGKNSDKLSAGLKSYENELKEGNLEFCVKKITLFQSTLTPQGPVYAALKEANLKNS